MLVIRRNLKGILWCSKSCCVVCSVIVGSQIFYFFEILIYLFALVYVISWFNPVFLSELVFLICGFILLLLKEVTFHYFKLLLVITVSNLEKVFDFYRYIRHRMHFSGIKWWKLLAKGLTETYSLPSSGSGKICKHCIPNPTCGLHFVWCSLL